MQISAENNIVIENFSKYWICTSSSIKEIESYVRWFYAISNLPGRIVENRFLDLFSIFFASDTFDELGVVEVSSNFYQIENEGIELFLLKLVSYNVCQNRI